MRVEKKPWSLKKKLAVWVALPLALAFGVLLKLDRVAQNDLNAAMRETRAIGGPVSFDELMAARKVWPEDHNGASVLLKISNGLLNLCRDYKQFDALPASGRDDELPLGHRLPPDQDRAVGEILARLAPELAQIDGLLAYEGGRFPLAIPSCPVEIPSMHLLFVRTSARLKAAQAQYRAMHGDTSQVVNDTRTVLLHGQLLADEPMLMSAMLRVWCEGLAVDTVQRTCALTTLTSEQLAKLQDCLTAAESQDRLSWAIRGERARFIEIADWHRNRGRMLMFPEWLGRVPGAKGLLMRDEAIGVPLHNRMIAAGSDRKAARKTAKEIATEMDKLPGYAWLTRLFVPHYERVLEVECKLEAQIRSAVAGLAAERYRLDHGRFPENLEDLVPQYLDQVPSDPFDNKPLRLRNRDGMVMIYSVGADLIDGGGDLVRVAGRRSCTDSGFILLPPEQRGRMATQPSTAPEEER